LHCGNVTTTEGVHSRRSSRDGLKEISAIGHMNNPLFGFRRLALGSRREEPKAQGPKPKASPFYDVIRNNFMT
jgi:hypothetical protein